VNVGAALMSVLRSAGVRYLFGNPGTTELTFLDALTDSGLEYILGLQEATAVAAADGYAQASGAVGVVNVHVLPGLANGVAILHNAARARSPLVVTAGQQDARLLLHEPILAGDLTRLAEPFCKWSHEVRSAGEAVPALRRALKVAATPPTGPVFLSLPMDLMTEEADGGAITPGPVVPVAGPADPAAVARAAGLLAAARAPLIVAGDGVARAGAEREVAALAEALGARIHGEPVYRRANVRGDHPLWRGGLFPTPAGVRKVTDTADAILVIGAQVFAWFLHTPGEPFPRGVPVIQIDVDPWEIGKSYPPTLGIVADPRAALAALREQLVRVMTAEDRAAAAGRAAALARAREEAAARAAAAAEAEGAGAPMGAGYLMRTLGALVPEDVIVVDESASSLPAVLRHLPFRRKGSFFGSKTGTLGWAAGAAIGVQLACPGRKVVVTIGDGSLMYAPQALWTAAHYRLPITYVVANNASYAILKSGMHALGLPSAKRGEYPGMDLVSPEIDYLALARAMGVRAERVEKPAELRPALAAALGHPGPALVDVAIDRAVRAML
jgi:benzoylformate decarboxylase